MRGFILFIIGEVGKRPDPTRKCTQKRSPVGVCEAGDFALTSGPNSDKSERSLADGPSRVDVLW
jgi:hypothetical protein